MVFKSTLFEINQSFFETLKGVADYDITFDWTSTKADLGLKHFAFTHVGNHLPLTEDALELIGGDDNQFPNKNLWII